MTLSFFMSSVLACTGMLIATSGALFSQTTSARDVLVRFCDLDSKGEQLSPEGWEKVATLFATPGAPQRDKIIVVRDFVVSNPELENGRAQFYVEYIQLGQIDPSSAHFPTLPAMKVRVIFKVVKTSDAGSSKVKNYAEWRIAERSVPEPHLTVDAAIRYATELREKAKDTATKQNAEKLLAALKRFR